MSPECSNCGSFVSHDWERVMGTNDGVKACPECAGAHVIDPRQSGGGEMHAAMFTGVSESTESEG